MEFEAVLGRLSQSDFSGRNEALAKIKRFSGDQRKPMFPVMHYRTDDEQHNRRVGAGVYAVLDTVSKVLSNFDRRVAGIASLIHDDDEIENGDAQLGQVVNLSPEEKRRLESKKMAGIRRLGRRYPNEIGGYSYGALIWEMHRKDTPEAQLISWLDKIEGACESIHEALSGNRLFITQPALGVEAPCLLYPKLLTDFPNKYPALRGLRESGHPLFSVPPDWDFEEIVQNGRLHTPESLGRVTGHPIYDAWKEIILNRFGSEGVWMLTCQRERFSEAERPSQAA